MQLVLQQNAYFTYAVKRLIELVFSCLSYKKIGGKKLVKLLCNLEIDIERRTGACWESLNRICNMRLTVGQKWKNSAIKNLFKGNYLVSSTTEDSTTSLNCSSTVPFPVNILRETRRNEIFLLKYYYYQLSLLT